ncbi:MAG: YncE family protein, partial [Candidatus Marinimicrobia bacterium]|nr:YncE family protein [Candidatus Neomarinimicrobiota bacterium]
TYKSAAKTGVWDIDSGKELARINNTRKVSHGVVISPDNKFAFVSVEGIGSEPGSVDVIDLSLLKLVDQADIGKQAGGIIFWKMEN